MNFKAAVLLKPGEPLEVVELQLPEKLDIGQVLVRVQAATICGAQVGELSGSKGPDPYVPHLMGHEGAGTVERVGPGVTKVKPGDYVVMHWRKGDGINAPFPKYYWKAPDVYVGAGNVTTFSQLSIVSENRVTQIDESVPPDIASLFGCAVTTAIGLINNEAQLKIGQSIVVLGVGGVGLNVIEAAAIAGGFPIIAIDQHAPKLIEARLHGATHVVNTADDEKWFRKPLEILNNGVDVVVDTTGAPRLIDHALHLVAPGGRLVLVGQPVAGHDLVLSKMSTHYKGKTILDSQGGLTNPTVDIPRYVRLYQAGRLHLDSMISATFSLNEVNQAFAAMKDPAAGRIALEVY